MKIRRITGLTALVAAGALALSACSSGGSDNAAKASASPTGPSTGIVTLNGSEPQNPLIPGNTTETGGAKLVTMLFSELVYYDAKGAPQNEVADSIKSTDNKTWTIKLKDGWKFSDGSPVNADSFIDAWDWTALFSNGYGGGYFFEPIVGYDATKDSHLKGAGLKKVDDLTFTVELTSPQADFPLRLGYTAFAPLPPSFFKDPKSFGEKPVGNGPYVLDSWNHDVDASLSPNPTYIGGRKPQNGGLKFVFYATQDAAYQDLQSDQLDVLDAVPDSAFSTYQSDLGDRAVNQPAAIFQAITIPTYLPHFKEDEEGRLRRAAISEAINRDQITKVIFQGTRTPATDYTSPVINGWSDKVEGNEVLKFDANKAKELWAQADAISKYDGTFTISYNADGGHQAWVEAVANSLKNTLGIKAEGKSYPNFAGLLKDEDARKMTGAFRSGWQADYPSLYNFLGPLYTKAAESSSNYGDYESSDFEAKLNEGLAAGSVEDANKSFQEAQTVLFKDLPAIPLWYSNVTGGSSTAVTDVVFGWDSLPLAYNIRKDG